MLSLNCNVIVIRGSVLMNRHRAIKLLDLIINKFTIIYNLLHHLKF